MLGEERRGLMNTSQLLAEFSSGLELTDIPEYIRDDLKIRMLDFVASAAAGHGVNRAMNAVVLKVITEQGGAEQSTLLFSRRSSLPRRLRTVTHFSAMERIWTTGICLQTAIPAFV